MLKAQDYWHGFYNNSVYDEFVYDLSYVKLRELSIGYNIPVDKAGNEQIYSGS